MRWRFGLCAFFYLLVGSFSANASGPRWVAGSPYFYAPGWLVYWGTDTPLYFTDPGDLSQYVNHSAADAIVDAAASVWNVPTSRLTLARGGVLDEDVSSANVYAGTSGIVFPADVQPANFQAKQIAVLYDRDGAITDMLLGSGASAPSSCRQNAVTESADMIENSGHIQHALLVLNGRCTGPAAEQQLQMQYQLERAFGRILGLSWSQTNDNVFTGTPRPTYQQALYWPVMHPIDVICGTYTYQCMPSPFTLRDDDIAGLDYLYPNLQNYPHYVGKVDTWGAASRVEGTISFPSGQGMQGVNVVVHRREAYWDVQEDWEDGSSVSGYMFRRRNGNPVSGALSGPPTIGMGTTDASYEGYFNVNRIPIADWEVWHDLIISTQPVNPLYVGSYAVGPYDVNSVDPSGTSVSATAGVVGRYTVVEYPATVPDAVTTCDTSADGTETAAAPAPSPGWWTGSLCSYGHSAWLGLSVQPGRNFTVEVTALDEQGGATTAKMMPVAGVWSADDPPGGTPSIASAAAAFNSTVNGMTTMSVPAASGSATKQLRMVIADQRGDGRPDYSYRARIFYADAVTPTDLPASGGAVTITGMGFRAGNAVTVNGVAATVSGWTENSITLIAPSLHAAGAVTADVAVRDLTTGAATSMTGVLHYAAPQPALLLVSAPSGQVFTGNAAATAFAVRAMAADGTTPLAGVPVSLTVTAGAARFSLCGAATCSAVTDSQGRVSSVVTPLAAGSVQLSAVSGIGTVTGAFTAVDRVQTITSLTPQLYIAAGARLTWPQRVVLSDNGASTAGVTVLWTAMADGVDFFPSVSLTDGSATATTDAEAGPLAAGVSVASTACAWGSICTGIEVSGVGADQWRLEPVSGVVQEVPRGTAFGEVVMRVVDGQGHAIAGAPVTVHQTLEPYSAACAGAGRCPIAPVYRASTTELVSALDGTVSFAPLDLGGSAIIARIAVATGTEGFDSFTATRLP